MKDMPLHSESTNNSRTTRRVSRIVIFGCLAAFALVMVFTFCGGVAFWYLSIPAEPTLDVALAVPPITAIGEQFDMHVEVSNNNSESVTLDSIDIDEEFLEGFQVLGIEPKSRDTLHVPILNQRSWTFDKPVAPNQTLVITFNLRPVSAGRYSGNVDVCNPRNDFTSQFVDVVVEP